MNINSECVNCYWLKDKKVEKKETTYPPHNNVFKLSKQNIINYVKIKFLISSNDARRSSCDNNNISPADSRRGE